VRILLGLVAAGTVAGCCSRPPAPDPQVHAKRLHQLAAVCSIARTPGPRTVAEVQSIDAIGAELQTYFGSLGR